MTVEVRFSDVDADGDREMVVENPHLRAVFRHPEHLGAAYYKRRWTWGGRLQSLVYKPTGREFFLPQMIDLEDISPFGLPDELFAHFPLSGGRQLKMGVGVLSPAGLEPLPWTWYLEQAGEETALVFRQEVADLEGYSYLYEKRYHFRPEAAWFALDVVWENRGKALIASDWDLHTFHDAGPLHCPAWLVAPKRAWQSSGHTRLRTVLKEAAPLFPAPRLEERIFDRLRWDLEGEPWWYATGPGDGEEFFLLNARFEPYWGLHFAGYGAYTPQGISHIEVPPGDRAVWGIDVTLGTGGKHFVRAGQEGGLTLERQGRTLRAGVHLARPGSGTLSLHLLNQEGALCGHYWKKGETAPGQPLLLELPLPEAGDFATAELSYQEEGRALLHTRELVPLQEPRPTAHLPFAGNGKRVLVASHHQGENPESDGEYLHGAGLQTGFTVDWRGPGPCGPHDLEGCAALCLVGEAWPLAQIGALRDWIEVGGGLLLCAPFGELAAALGDLLPLQSIGPMQRAETPLGLRLGAPHCTVNRLMLEPDAQVRVSWWAPTIASPDALVPLRFTDPDQHPALGLDQYGKGRVAVLASRPAWGAHRGNVVWDGWGQYYRAFFAGLLGWTARIWNC
ncbi:MAG: hypothetical protein FJY95_08655 [Candidatus Handelsmanbacteria bacterium]|nr:hypothetical protein [Candidatus Handelsmanbacteria bacterium]